MKKYASILAMLAMMILPAVASAQHVAPEPVRARPDGPPSAPVVEDEDDSDDLFAFMFGEDDDLIALHEADEDAPGGERRVVERRVIRGDSGPGMAMMHEGMGPHGRHAGRRGGRGMHQMMMARFARLDLTDAQREKLRDIHEGMMRKNVQRQADTKLAMMDLHKAMSAENPSASAVNAQIDKVAKLRADGMKAHFDAMMQAKGVLSAEQWKKLHSPGGMRKGGPKGPGGMRHGGMGHGDGN